MCVLWGRVALNDKNPREGAMSCHCSHSCWVVPVRCQDYTVLGIVLAWFVALWVQLFKCSGYGVSPLAAKCLVCGTFVLLVTVDYATFHNSRRSIS
jgi:hypothetical protein